LTDGMKKVRITFRDEKRISSLRSKGRSWGKEKKADKGGGA